MPSKVIHYLLFKAAQATRNICKAFGENIIIAQYKTNSKVFSNDEILEDEPRSGRSSIINDKKLEALINSDSHQTCQQLVRKLMLTKKLLDYTCSK